MQINMNKEFDSTTTSAQLHRKNVCECHLVLILQISIHVNDLMNIISVTECR